MSVIEFHHHRFVERTHRTWPEPPFKLNWARCAALALNLALWAGLLLIGSHLLSH